MADRDGLVVLQEAEPEEQKAHEPNLIVFVRCVRR